MAVPLIDAQTCFSSSLYPAQLVELKSWYAEQYGDYLMKEKPGFFLGLVWVEILLLWPLSIANVYGILSGKRWAATTSLMTGVSAGTSMVLIASPFFTLFLNKTRYFFSMIFFYLCRIFLFLVCISLVNELVVDDRSPFLLLSELDNVKFFIKKVFFSSKSGNTKCWFDIDT